MRMAAAGSVPSLLAGVLVTHLHSDHVTGLDDVITTHWIMSSDPTPLRIWGPVGIADFIHHTMAALESDISYRIAHHADLTWRPTVEVAEVAAGDRFQVGESSVAVHQTEHAPVEPSIGFRLEHGHYVVALAGDTVPCAGLDDLCADADAYVQSVIRDDLVRAVPNRRLHDIVDYHSSVAQAGQTAARNRVGRLVLTHMVPAPAPGGYDEWIAVAAANFDGEIVIGDDLTTVDLVER